MNSIPKVSGSSSCAHFFSCSHEITDDSNANQTSQTDLEKENFNEKDNDEETMLVSMLKLLIRVCKYSDAGTGGGSGPPNI